MRKLALAAAVLLVAWASGFAQGFENYDYSNTSTTTASSSSDQKLSAYLGVGVGFSLGGQYVGRSQDVYSPTVGPDRYSEINDQYINLGRGLKFDLGASYRFVEHVDALLGFNLSLGVPRTDVEEVTTNEGVTGKTSDMTTYHDAQCGFKLMLVPRFTAFDLFDIYIGAGLGLYWTSFSYEREYQAAGGPKFSEEVKYDCKASLPFIGAIGAEYPLSKRFIIFLDLTYEAMNVTLQKIEVESQTTGMPGGAVNETFEKDAEDRAAPPKFPASSLAIRLGLRIPLF